MKVLQMNKEVAEKLERYDLLCLRKKLLEEQLELLGRNKVNKLELMIMPGSILNTDVDEILDEITECESRIYPIREALDNLSKFHRSMINMKYSLKMRWEDIGAAIGYSTKRAQYKLIEAVHEVAEHIKEYKNE